MAYFSYYKNDSESGTILPSTEGTKAPYWIFFLSNYYDFYLSVHSFLTVSMEQKLCLTASTATLWAPCNMTVNISCNQKSKAERWKVMSMKRSHVLMQGTAVTAAISVDNEKKCPYLTFIHKRDTASLQNSFYNFLIYHSYWILFFWFWVLICMCTVWYLRVTLQTPSLLNTEQYGGHRFQRRPGICKQ